MFKNVSSEGGLAGGRSLASPAGLRASPAGLSAQESSWLGLLSVLSRPALSFVSKYLPGGGGATSGSTWGAPGDAAQDRDRHCASAWSQLSDGGERSLRQLGIEPGRNPEASTSGTFLAWEAQSSRLGGLWGGFRQGHSLSSPLSHADLGSAQNRFCASQSSTLTKDESAGASVHKEEALVSGARNHGGAAGEQDNGYHSLEEELGLKCHACRSASELKQTDGGGLPDQTTHEMEAAGVPEDGPPDHMAAKCLVTADEMGAGHACQSAAALCDAHVEPPTRADSPGHVTEDGPPEQAAPPQCRNVGIAFIMGCPCSDDDGQSDADSAHDDGFDSSGSSDLSSDWSDEDGDAADEETVHLLASLCRRDDPYNPQNFSARLHTGRAAPRPLPASAQDVWDDSGDETDEAESRLLLASLASSDPYSLLNFQAPLCTEKAHAPPPRATQAPPPRATQAPPPRATQAPPPRATRPPAADRKDGGRTRPFTSAKKVRFSDVVEEFFVASGGAAAEDEDRRGPWEELARDRGRFLRRCREAELSLAYCLQPEHRRRAYRRISGHDAD